MTLSDEPALRTDPSDRDTVTMGQVATGNSEGLRRLLQEHGGGVRARLVKDFGRTLDDAEIDEAMSSMVVRVWHAARRFDRSKGTLRAWATVIARNCALRLIELRRQRVHSNPDLDRLQVPVNSFAQPTAERQRLRIDLLACIERLPRLQRAVLLADLEAGNPAPAEPLAQRFGTTANSIYVSRQKGRQAIRRALTLRGHDFAARPNATRPVSLRPFLQPRTEHA